MSFFPLVSGKLSDLQMPDQSEIQRVFQLLVESYPGFSDLMRGTHTESEIVTQLPIGGLFEPPMPIPGLVLVGDSVGFVKSTSGSGILAGSQFAKEIVAWCSARTRAVDFVWTNREQQGFNRSLMRSKVYRKIKLIYKVITWFQTLMLVKLRTPERINARWGLFKLVTRF